MPFLLQKFNLDPASASAPLITTMIDIFGIVIYFSIATAFLTMPEPDEVDRGVHAPVQEEQLLGQAAEWALEYPGINEAEGYRNGEQPEIVREGSQSSLVQQG